MISYTEGKLDYLYKVAGELEDNLRLTHQKILKETNREMIEKLQRAESSRKERLAALRK